MSGPGFVDQVRAALGDGGVVTDPDLLEGYRRDEAPLVEAGTPLAVALPTSAEEVAAVMRAAGRHRVPVVARGAGSGLAGGANAVDGGVVLSLARMDAILEVDADEQLARAQPGVLNATLSRAAAEAGLWYPPDPASWEFSTIGGNVATNAGGLCCVKYGVTRDAVIGLEVVLADGTVTRIGRRTAKGVAGYDLVGLFVGSEGTLGVVTEITVRLRRPQSAPATTVASFSSLEGAGAAITEIMRTASPSLLEILDATTIAAVEGLQRMDLDTDAAALLIGQSDLPGELGRAESALLDRACRAAGADLVVTTDDPDEAEMLLTARRLAYPALERQGTSLLDDVAVPRGRIPELIAAVEEISARHGVLIGTFGHAGDGNLHPTLIFDAADPQARAAATAAFDDVVSTALDLGGTVTGEHGVGLLKRRHLAAELDDGAVGVHRAIKDALDPDHLLNPGKLW